jgi:phage shock protein PspC (stress-responsive transcriptional regulator)
MEPTAPLRRSTTDAKVAGVCAGLARAWNIDPVILRVGVAALALTGGAGVVLYLAGWLLMPREGQQRTAPPDAAVENVAFENRTFDNKPSHDTGTPDAPGSPSRVTSLVRGATAAVLVLICIGLLARIKPVHAAPAIVMALFCYVAFYRPRRRARAEAAAHGPGLTPLQAPPAGPATFQASAAPSPGRHQEDRPLSPEELADLHRAQFLAAPDPVGLYTEVPTPPPPARSRPGQSRSARRLRLACLAAVTLALAVLAAVDSLGATVPSPAYLAVALLGVGLCLVAATWLGRARGLLPAGILLSVVVLGSTVASTVESTQWHPDAVSPITTLPSAPLAQDTGTLAVDLSQVTMTRDATVAARVERGVIAVTVPRNVTVVVRYDIGGGALMVLDNDPDFGRDLQGETIPVRGQPGWPTLTLDLAVERGAIWVER